MELIERQQCGFVLNWDETKSIQSIHRLKSAIFGFNLTLSHKSCANFLKLSAVPARNDFSRDIA
jgi:hypothetical protein